MKIIHIIEDEKFVGMAAKAFEAVYPNCNSYISFSKNKINKSKFKVSNYPRFLVFFKFIIRRILNANVVIFHSMGEKNLLLLKSLPDSAKVIWIGWGYDYYDLINKELLKEEALRLFNIQKDNIDFKNKIFNCFLSLLRKRKREWLKKVDVFAPVIFEDFQLVKEGFPELKAKYVSWNYGTIEDDHVRGFEDKVVNGDNILIGNSASYTSNHLDAFLLLKNIELDGKKILVPLSYGEEEYREIVLLEGRKLFGNNFQPLIEFMPIDEYIEILQSCSIVVMNHLRQQALGNIVIAVYMGAKVFLDKKNPIYDFFIKQGAYLFSLEELEGEMNSRLDQCKVEYNRNLLKNYWSREVILRKTKELVEEAIKS